MVRSRTIGCTLLLLAASPVLAMDAGWPGAAATEGSVPLLEMSRVTRAAVHEPALAILLGDAPGNGVFRFDAAGYIEARLALETAFDLDSVETAIPLAHAPTAPKASAPPSDLTTGSIPATRKASVLDDMAVAQALQAALAGPAPTADLRTQWAAIAAVYQASFQSPLWRADGHWSEGARTAVARLALAREDAIDLSATPLPAFSDGDPAAIAAQDLGLTAAVVSYARQASGSRVDPQKISHLISAKPQIPDARTILLAVTAAGSDAGKILQDFNPPQPAYQALREKLAELARASTTPVAKERIPPGPPLRVGMRDERVKLIRTRFGLGIHEPESPDSVLYDTRVAEAVAGFQKQNGLPASGVLTPRTVALLSGGEPGRLENEIVANMERWRWMPRDLGRDRIEVDIPNYTVSVIRNDAVTHRARVIVGKPTNPTPVFSNTMKFAVVNPSWYIPPSILKKEILPKLAGDPGYLARLGYEMKVKRGQISVRQPPGERNALGHIKFMFPNEHSVYLHDTPSRGLFTSTKRAFSHGCVRVDDPMAFAESVLGGPWSAARVKSLVGRGERTINLAEPLPIHLEYFTASVGADGRLMLRDDIYGYDSAVIRALGWKS